MTCVQNGCDSQKSAFPPRNACDIVRPLASTASAQIANCGATGITHAQFQAALNQAVAAESSGLDLQMWATMVDPDGIVCFSFVASSRVQFRGGWPHRRCQP